MTRFDMLVDVRWDNRLITPRHRCTDWTKFRKRKYHFRTKCSFYQIRCWSSSRCRFLICCRRCMRVKLKRSNFEEILFLFLFTWLVGRMDIEMSNGFVLFVLFAGLVLVNRTVDDSLQIDRFYYLDRFDKHLNAVWVRKVWILIHNLNMKPLVDSF